MYLPPRVKAKEHKVLAYKKTLQPNFIPYEFSELDDSSPRVLYNSQMKLYASICTIQTQSSLTKISRSNKTGDNQCNLRSKPNLVMQNMDTDPIKEKIA